MVLRGDVNVVYVKQDSAIRLFHNFIQELPLRHLRYVKLGIAADIFYGNGNFKKILRFSDLLRCHSRRLEGVRHRQQVVAVGSINAAPAKVIGEPWCLRAAHQCL